MAEALAEDARHAVMSRGLVVREVTKTVINHVVAGRSRISLIHGNAKACAVAAPLAHVAANHQNPDAVHPVCCGCYDFLRGFCAPFV